MAEQFEIQCECGRDVRFALGEVAGLEDHISEMEGSAAIVAGTSTRREVEAEFEDYINPDIFTDFDRPLFELAIAIRRGNREEAELHLDRIAREIGGKAVEEVELARFSPRARVSA